MRLALLACLVASTACPACRDTSSGGSRTVDISTYAGTQPEPGVTVISHTASGAVIDRAVADAVGRANIGVDDDALVSVVFPGSITTATPIVSVVTTTAPTEGVELAIHGPGRAGPGLIVGALEVTAPNLAAADYFDIDVGCATVRVTALPEFIDIGACSLGSDQSLDVLARAYHDDTSGMAFDGYAAGRVVFGASPVSIDLPAWQTSGTPVPIALAGVSPLVTWTLFADGVPFVDEPITGSAFVYANLVVDTTHIRASIPGVASEQITDRYVAGTPSSIPLAEQDFLTGFDVSTEITRTAPFALAFDAAPNNVDAIHLRATWRGATANVVPSNHSVVWDAVLPPHASAVSLPDLDDDLGLTLAGAAGISDTDILLRHLDSSLLADFEALQGAGIYADDSRATSTIVPRPAVGQVRTAQAIGLR